MSTSLRRGRLAVLVGLSAATALTLAACSSSGGGGSSKAINVVAYSVPKPAYTALATAFEKTSAGKGVKINPSYGPSGAQANSVLSGEIKADFVNFSVGSDMSKLVPSKVASSWDTGATQGVIADSVVVLVVRKGNPKHITGWNDLIKPGIKIVTPDPASSGSAKWNILAAYESVIDSGGTPAQASAYLTKFFKNVVSRAASGSVATQQFLSGTGDVLISYEAEAIAARQAGDDIQYIVPQQNVLIQTVAATTIGASPAAKNFLTFAESPAGQAIFASKGFRPALAGVSPGTVAGANDPSSPFPTPTTLVTIAQLGGWTVVNNKFFGTSGIVTKIESSG
jgi:sulfate/thiosulfate transport system substrate-binding protein